MDEPETPKDSKEGPAQGRKTIRSEAEAILFLLGAETFIGPDLMREIRELEEEGVLGTPFVEENPQKGSVERE